MVGTSTDFTNERAPCGKRVSGHRYHEDDGSGIALRRRHLRVRLSRARARVPRRQLPHAHHPARRPGAAERAVRRARRVAAEPAMADHDVVVVGGGGAGLRAAIAIVQAQPRLSVAIVSKVYPMRSHTVSAEGGAAAVIATDDSLDEHAYDTVSGSDWLCDQDAVEAFVAEAPRELLQLEHWGCPWSRTPDGRGRGPRVRRHEEDAHLVRGRQDRLPPAAHAVPDVAAVPADHPLRRVVRDHAAGRREPGAGRRRRSSWPPAGSRPSPAGPSILCTGGCGRVFPFTDQRQHQDRRRDGARLPRGRPAEGHGVRPVPPDRPAVHRHPDHRGGAGRGRLAAQQGRLPLPAGLRPRHALAHAR